MRRKQAKTGKAVLIYDDNCPVCSKAAEWIKKNERKDSFELLPCQSEELRKRFPFIKETTCMRAMQLILPDGQIFSGEKAIPRVLERLKRYAAAAKLFRLPGSETLARSFYRWFADNRYHLASVLFPEKKIGKQPRGK